MYRKYQGFLHFLRPVLKANQPKNTGIGSVLTRQDAESIFQLVLLHLKDDNFYSIFATAHPDSRGRQIGPNC